MGNEISHRKTSHRTNSTGDTDELPPTNAASGASASRPSNNDQPVDASDANFSFVEVANHLNVSPETLQRMSQRFAPYLQARVYDEDPEYTNTDVAALFTVQKLLSQGYQDEQITEYLKPQNSDPETERQNHTDSSTALASTHDMPDANTNMLPSAVSDILNTIVTGQQAVLNGQTSVREVVGVVVQDNFNLKDENRKLRDRMLELERALAEYQRREETRKERMESRLRAMEGTVAALQQQVAQLVQIQRQQRKRRGWFG